MNFGQIVQAVLGSFSVALIYVAVDLFISLKPVVHKYVKSKTLINVYDLLESQVPGIVKSNALDKNVAISENKAASIAQTSAWLERNGFNVTPQTVTRYVDQAEHAYKAAGGKFVQATNEVAQDTMDDVFNSLVAANPEASSADSSVHSVATSQAPAPSATIGSDSNAK